MELNMNTPVNAFKQQPTVRFPLILLKETLFKVALFVHSNDRMHYL